MIFRVTAITSLLGLVARVTADVAPDITILAEGYNYIAKLPCIDCPHLYYDTSSGANGSWIEHNDDNALLLNISLPLDATHLSINDANLLSGSFVLPRIYASQVLQDYSADSLNANIASNELDTAGPSVGLSYGTSLHRVTNSSALVFRFNILSLHFALSNPPARIPLSGSHQKVLELILFPRPLHGAGDSGSGWEIATVRFSEREKKGSRRPMKMMMFDDWDEFGRKGSPLHLVSSSSSGVLRFAGSGGWGLSITILGFVAVFVIVVLGIVYAVERYSGEYDRAQSGKSRRGASKESGSWADVEKAKGRFLSASELGRGEGSVVGMGKSD